MSTKACLARSFSATAPGWTDGNAVAGDARR
jgi:hypothetical protein